MGQPPKVNPKFADFVCIPNVDQLPWVQGYDIKGDGIFGVDDLKARLVYPEDILLDSNEESLDLACRQAKIGFIQEEVKWKLRDLMVQQSQESRSATSLFQSIRELKDVALRRIQDLDGKKELGMSKKVVSAIIEMELRARLIVSGAGPAEPFGIYGNGLVVEIVSPAVWQGRFDPVHPASNAARAGIVKGDILLAVDDRPLRELSRDGTIAGLVDPETEMLRGMGGPRDSKVKITIRRGDQKLDFVLERNIWSARTLSTEDIYNWDGTEKMDPPSFPTPLPKTNGCGCNLGARP